MAFEVSPRYTTSKLARANANRYNQHSSTSLYVGNVAIGLSVNLRTGQ